ncbi:MAG: hypothetical protein AB1491_10570 [Thermodesulfobacteriota bacterium]
MTEANLRKWHRTMGIFLALFIVLQAGSGVLLNTVSMIPAAWAGPAEQGEAWWERLAERIHLGGGFVGKVYRLGLGFGVMGMAASGSLIFLKIRARGKK